MVLKRFGIVTPNRQVVFTSTSFIFSLEERKIRMLMCDFYIKFNYIFMINDTLLIIIHQFIPPFITRLETTGLHGVVYEYESSLLV